MLTNDLPMVAGTLPFVSRLSSLAGTEHSTFHFVQLLTWLISITTYTTMILKHRDADKPPSQQLAELRQKLGLTLAEAGQRAGLFPAQVILAESGGGLLSVIAALARGYGRRLRIDAVRNRKTRVVDLASDSGLSLNTTVKALGIIAEPNSVKNDLAMDSLMRVVKALNGQVLIVR